MGSGTVLIGYQPTPEGRDAARLGRLFAELLGAKPLVASVFPWPAYLVPVEEAEAGLSSAASSLFDEARAELEGLEPETRVFADRSPALALQRLAAESDAELIVVGSSNRGVLGRTLAGSVGESLLADAPCAVAVASRGLSARPQAPVARIGVAFDGSPEARSALETAVELAGRLGAQVYVVTVAEFPRYGLGTSYSILTKGEYEDAERQEKKRILQRALDRVPDELRAEGQLLTGGAGAKLAEAAADYDLMVAGSRGYGAVRRTALGSATRVLVREAPCPILVVPRGAGDE